MNLQSAIEQGKKLSKKGNRRAYLVIAEDGECSVSRNPSHLDKAAFYKGEEIPLDQDVEKPNEVITKTKTNVKTKEKKSVAKKAAKKVAAKKSAKKATKKVAANHSHNYY